MRKMKLLLVVVLLAVVIRPASADQAPQVFDLSPYWNLPQGDDTHFASYDQTFDGQHLGRNTLLVVHATGAGRHYCGFDIYGYAFWKSDGAMWPAIGNGDIDYDLYYLADRWDVLWTHGHYYSDGLGDSFTVGVLYHPSAGDAWYQVHSKRYSYVGESVDYREGFWAIHDPGEFKVRFYAGTSPAYWEMRWELEAQYDSWCNSRGFCGPTIQHLATEHPGTPDALYTRIYEMEGKGMVRIDMWSACDPRVRRLEMYLYSEAVSSAVIGLEIPCGYKRYLPLVFK